MEFISVFDVFKIGVGPSSSHTLGPWKAAGSFITSCHQNGYLQNKAKVSVHLYGSLSLTGKGHATDLAVTMGLAGYNPVTVETAAIQDIIETIKEEGKIIFQDKIELVFNPDEDIHFEKEFLPFHANSLVFIIETPNNSVFSETYYSVGGGFIVREGQPIAGVTSQLAHPFPILNNEELIHYCQQNDKNISEIVLLNELVDRPCDEIKTKLLEIWEVMLDSIYTGCHSFGILPGGLKVKRRASEVTSQLNKDLNYDDKLTWITAIRHHNWGFQDILKWVSSFAIAVNEVNAAFGRVVTAPTNGSAGVIPAVLMYYLCFINKDADETQIIKYLLTTGEMGSIFKKGSTISAAMGGCQAEIGVSSAMAAAGLTELLGGSPEQCSIAAEVAMEHHLGMTCDPIAGLVQVPCIERNSMGAIKAINAASIALDRNPADIKVPLDKVIKTMWETAKDMDRKYKETSEGGLATSVNIIDC